MSEMFERFTDRSRRVVVLSQEQARLMKHGYIGTEHLLLGIVQEDESLAAQVLKHAGMSLETISKNVLGAVGEGETSLSGHIPFTPRAKKVLELGLREALQLGHNYVAPEHLLLGLIREGQGHAAQVLDMLGLPLDKARQQVIHAITGAHTHTAPPSAPDPGPVLSHRRLDEDAAAIIEALSGKRVARSWPYTTPTGHTYHEPTTYAEVQERATDAAQAWVETWDPREHPPEPTWEMVGIAQVEVRRLGLLLAKYVDLEVERLRSLERDLG